MILCIPNSDQNQFQCTADLEAHCYKYLEVIVYPVYAQDCNRVLDIQYKHRLPPNRFGIVSADMFRAPNL